MKKTLFGIFGLALLFASCDKKDKTNPPVEPNVKVSKITYEDIIAEYVYNSNGTLKEIRYKEPDNSLSGIHTIEYANGKVSRMDADFLKFVYTYPNANTTRIDVQAASGESLYYQDFVFANNRLREWVQLSLGTGTAVPYEKAVYNYNAAGNVIKVENYEFENNAWVKIEEVNIVSYDNKKNHSSHLENTYYLGNTPFLTNNPLREEHRSPEGALIRTVEHQYTYDAQGRVTKRKTITKEVGGPEELEEVLFAY